MFSQRVGFWVCLWLVHLLYVAPVAALKAGICSSQNTGGSTTYMNSLFQSNGLCHDHCRDFLYAIVQGRECWCSDLAPTEKSGLGECDRICPGTANEQCGNADSGLFGYIVIVPTTPVTTPIIGYNDATSSLSPTAVSLLRLSLFTSTDTFLSSLRLSSSQSEKTPSGGASLSATTPPSMAPSSTAASNTAASSAAASSTVASSTAASSTTSSSTTSSSTTSSSTAASSTTSSSTTSSSAQPPTESSSPSGSGSGFASFELNDSTTAPPASTLASSVQISNPNNIGSTVGESSTSGTPSSADTLPLASNEPPLLRPTLNSILNSKGKTAGLFTGVGLIVVALAGVCFYFWRRRREQPEDTELVNTLPDVSFIPEDLRFNTKTESPTTDADLLLKGTTKIDYDFMDSPPLGPEVPTDYTLPSPVSLMTLGDIAEEAEGMDDASSGSVADNLDYSRKFF